MTDVLVKKKTLTNQSFLKIKENQKVNHGGDSRYFLFIILNLNAVWLFLQMFE